MINNTITSDGFASFTQDLDKTALKLKTQLAYGQFERIILDDMVDILTTYRDLPQSMSQLLESYDDRALFILGDALEKAIDNDHDDTLMNTLKNRVALISSKTVVMKLTSILVQTDLNKRLLALGISHQISDCKRLIITSADVIEGLNAIQVYLDANHMTIKSLITEGIGASNIRLSEGFQLYSLTGFEIAWGLIDHCFRHEDDKPFVTTSFYIAEKNIGLLQKHSTLLLDGYGSKVSASFGEYKQKMAPFLSEKLSALIALDVMCNIDHVILQSCSSGTLLEKSGYFLKDAKHGKVKKKIYNDQPGLLFSEIRSMRSLAECMYFAIKHRGDIAFTFSEYFINPSNQLTGGNLGVQMLSEGEKLKWPENVAIKEKLTLKSYTICSHGHRKAPSPDKKYQYVAEPHEEINSSDYSLKEQDLDPQVIPMQKSPHKNSG